MASVLLAPAGGGGGEEMFPPRPSASFWRFVVDRNPFFLLSAVCMFAGCRVIIAALGVSPGEVYKLVGLIGVLNVYELLLIGLALFLIKVRGQHRDGWILLGIESLFLVDLTHLNGEVFAASARLGLAVNGACFALAMVKIAVVVRVLGLRVRPAYLGMIAVQLAALFGMAGVLKWASRDGAVSPAVIYAAWWGMAAIPVLWTVAGRRREAAAVDDKGNLFAPLPRRLYVLVPFVSLLVHLCGANRIYWVHFHVANVAPLLLGFAVLVGQWRRAHPSAVANLQMTLSAAAVLITLWHPRELTYHWGGVDWTALRLALAGAAAVSLYALWLHRRWAFGSMATACVATAALGRSVDEMSGNLAAFTRWLVESARSLVPSTPLQWGVVAVAASFVLLGLGAAVSLRRPHKPAGRG